MGQKLESEIEDGIWKKLKKQTETRKETDVLLRTNPASEA
jgi:hypothetical protein